MTNEDKYETLKYTYNSARMRAKVHPDIMEKSIKDAENIPRFNSEKEAMIYARTKLKENIKDDIKLWATVKKDKERYYLSAPWIVTVGAQVTAAEYVGFCYLKDIE